MGTHWRSSIYIQLTLNSPSPPALRNFMLGFRYSCCLFYPINNNFPTFSVSTKKFIITIFPSFSSNKQWFSFISHNTIRKRKKCYRRNTRSWRKRWFLLNMSDNTRTYQSMPSPRVATGSQRAAPYAAHYWHMGRSFRHGFFPKSGNKCFCAPNNAFTKSAHRLENGVICIRTTLEIVAHRPNADSILQTRTLVNFSSNLLSFKVRIHAILGGRSCDCFNFGLDLAITCNRGFYKTSWKCFCTIVIFIWIFPRNPNQK